MDSIRGGNPFTPMAGIDPKFFGGRKKELEYFKEKLNNVIINDFCEHFLILGDWGIGKSALLSEFKKICQNQGFIAPIVKLETFQQNDRLSDAANSIVSLVLRGLPFDIKQFQKVIDFFNSIGITILGSGFKIERRDNKHLMPEAFLHDFFINLYDDIKYKHKSKVLVILLDDLSNLKPVSEIIMTLRQMLSMDKIKERKIVLGMTSTWDFWKEITQIERYHPIARTFLSRVELKHLTYKELVETIRMSLKGTGISFSENIVKKVYDITKGHPFEMQVLCKRLFENQLSKKADINIWEKSLYASIEDMGMAIFDFWYNQTSKEEKKLLNFMTKKNKIWNVQELQNSSKKGYLDVRSNSITKLLQRLLEKNIIIKESRGAYKILDPMFREYVNFKSI